MYSEDTWELFRNKVAVRIRAVRALGYAQILSF